MMGQLRLIVFWTSLAIADSAWACPVCFSAKNKENQIAYLATTGFLTFLPLLFAGGVMLWIRRRAQQLAHETLPKPGQLVALEAEAERESEE